MRAFIATRHPDFALVALILVLVFPATESLAHTSGDHDEADRQHDAAAGQDGTELCGSSTTVASGFNDVAYGHIHAAAIRCMAAYGIIHGRSDGSFLPRADLTRGQMASLLARFMDASTPGFSANLTHDAHPSEMTFHDTANTVHGDSIAMLVGSGVATGVSETLFEPLGVVTREQLASFLYRTFRSLGVGFADNYPSAFRDVSSGSVHAQAIDALAAEGIINGTSSSTFEPRGPVTRAQTATLLHRSAARLHQAGRWGSPWPGGLDGMWNDPDTWPDGRVPTADDDVIIDGHVVVAGPVLANSVTVAGGSTLEFDATTAAQLEVSGNVIIEGTLRMRPSSAGVEHALRFVDVDEEAFIGGGHAVLDSDVGLWFTGHGRADIQGHERLAWTRAATSLAKGATTVRLEAQPEGWRVGDEIVITPTEPPGTNGTANGYSTGRIVSISGDRVQLDTALVNEHPRVADQWGAEVMNLTRNVRIEGTPDGRAHVLFNHTHEQQHLRNLALRHMGPRQETGEVGYDGPFTAGVVGRYPLHFHHNGDGSIGSQVQNVVVRDSGHRAFVAHGSNGVTFRGTIAHDVFDTPYWWDAREGEGQDSPPSDNITYDQAVASQVTFDPPFRGYRLAGFELGHGSNTAVIGSVAVGIQGNGDAAGFVWPEHKLQGNHPVHWRFEKNVAHNNRVNGVFVWQNTADTRHVIVDSTFYHNGQNGIAHGAYDNRYRYTRISLYGNAQNGVLLHSQNAIQFTDVVFDGGGLSQFGFATTLHELRIPGAALIRPTFRRYTDRAVAFQSHRPEDLDIIEPTFEGPKSTWFHLSDRVPADSLIRVQMPDGTAFRLHPLSADVGEPVPEWNARREPIAPFH